jgi:ABC-2 type transport system permease protein
MRWLLQVRSELRKLSSTKIPLGFLLGLLALSATTVIAVLVGTDADGSKGFISTAADQQSLMAFAANALMIAALFGAIAVAREYGHGTVIPTYLASPRRHRAVLAQLAAVTLAGALLGLVGNALTLAGVAAALPTIDYEFMLDAPTVARLLAASAFTGGLGALLGAGVGSVVRNVGGSVTATVFLLFILPPSRSNWPGVSATGSRTCLPWSRRGSSTDPRCQRRSPPSPATGSPQPSSASLPFCNEMSSDATQAPIRGCTA